MKNLGAPQCATPSGPWRTVPTDAELAGSIVALGFVTMGVVRHPD